MRKISCLYARNECKQQISTQMQSNTIQSYNGMVEYFNETIRRQFNEHIAKAISMVAYFSLIFFLFLLWGEENHVYIRCLRIDTISINTDFNYSNEFTCKHAFQNHN